MRFERSRAYPRAYLESAQRCLVRVVRRAIKGRRHRRTCSTCAGFGCIAPRRGDWRRAAALLEAGWPETWGAQLLSPDDVFSEIDADISRTIARWSSPRAGEGWFVLNAREARWVRERSACSRVRG